MGLLWGDIIGSYYEFTAPHKIFLHRTVSDLHTKKNVFKLGFGHYTDDTALTLAAMQSFVDCRGKYNLEDQKQKVRMYYNGYFSSSDYCFDIGSATLLFIDECFDLALTVKDSGGNGFLMKLLPFAMYSALNIHDVKSKRKFYKKCVVKSHGHFDAVATAISAGFLLESALTGKIDWDSPIPNYKHTRDSRGFCVGTYNIVVDELNRGTGLEEGFGNIIRRGFDTDTNSAIFGMFCAIRDGAECVDMSKVKYHENITRTFEEFFQCISPKSY